MLPLYCLAELYGSVDRLFFFFNDTATTEIYTLSLHDALPISWSLTLKGDGTELEYTFDARDGHSDIPSLLRRVTDRSEEHTSELQSQSNLVCRLLLEKKKEHRSRLDHQWSNLSQHWRISQMVR